MFDVQGDAWKRQCDQFLAGLKDCGPLGRIGRYLDGLDRRSAGYPGIFVRVTVGKRRDG